MTSFSGGIPGPLVNGVETQEACEACRHRLWRDPKFRRGKRARFFGIWPHVPDFITATCAACGREELFVAGTIRIADVMGGDWTIYDTGLKAFVADIVANRDAELAVASPVEKKEPGNG